MRRFFNILLGALAMLAVALLAAFLTMRLVIHGREVEIPNVAGLTVAEANTLAASLGLNMNLENHFYSTVTPAGRILSQSPAPGTKVRREWVLRVTESIGPQKVSVPNVVGQTEREASVTIRRLSLDLGTVAYIPAPGQPGVVLSQTPTPAAAGVDGPRISLLVSEPVPAIRMRPAEPLPAAPGDTTIGAAAPDTASAAQDDVAAPAAAATPAPAAAETPAAAPAQPAEAEVAAYVMPNLIGLSLSAASARVSSMGLHISSMEVVPISMKHVAPITAPSPIGSGQGGAALAPVRPIAPITLSNTVISQTPAAGRRVTKTDPIRITLTR